MRKCQLYDASRFMGLFLRLSFVHFWTGFGSDQTFPPANVKADCDFAVEYLCDYNF
jgi:hypothetical protein